MEKHTLDSTGLQTRFGGRIDKIHGIGHSKDDWWLVVDIGFTDADLPEREIHPCMIVYDHEDEQAHQNMLAVSDAVMDHLRKHGFWDARGRWVATS